MVYRLINHAICWQNWTREEFVNYKPQTSDLRILRVFFQHPKWFIVLLNQRDLWSIAFNYNNSKDARFFHEFTATINHSWLTNQSARIDLVIITSIRSFTGFEKSKISYAYKDCQTKLICWWGLSQVIQPTFVTALTSLDR